MDKLNCNAKLDRDAKKIVVSNLAHSELEISISGDVDFTNLVQELTKKIDEEKIIVLTVEEEVSITDPKDKLIIETLKNIFDSYNKSLQHIEEITNGNDDSEIPF